MKIHYTQGPECLSDVSIECSDAAIAMLKDNADDAEILTELELTSEQLTVIKAIYQSKMRRCVFCGNLFTSSASRRRVCYNEPHFLPCIDCGKPVQVKESYAEYIKAGGRRCWDCRNARISNVSQSKSPEEIKAKVDKMQATMVARYGAKVPLQCPELKAKIQQTVKSRYGVDNLSQSPEIQKRIKANSIAKYGKTHYSQDPVIRKHMTDGMINKFGVSNPMKSQELKAKAQRTNLKKYGVKNVFQSAEIRQHAMDKHKAEYGVCWPNQRKEHLTDPSKYDNYLGFLDDPRQYVISHFNIPPTAIQLALNIGLDGATIDKNKAKLLGIEDLLSKEYYTMESEVCNEIYSINLTSK